MDCDDGTGLMRGEDNLLKLVVPEPAEGYRLQEQIGFVLRKAHQRHVAIFAAKIADLTPPQFAALAKLADVGETSQNQLGSLIAMDAATVKGVIDRLKARGLVELTRHDVDKRRLMVSLTAEGRAMVERLVPLAEEISAATLSQLSPKDAATLLRLLAKIA
jgi:DNA-binding MarR family transcriptional regulator